MAGVNVPIPASPLCYGIGAHRRRRQVCPYTGLDDHLGLGSTIIGFVPEYLLVISIVAVVGDWLGFDGIFAVAIVGIAAKIG